MRVTKRRLLIGMGILVVVSMAGAYQFYRQAQTLWQQTSVKNHQLYTVIPGQTLIHIFKKLHPLNRLEVMQLKLWLKLHPKLAHIKSGTYEISAHAKFSQIAALLRSGKVYQYRLTLVEGESLSQWRKEILAAPGLKKSSLNLAQISDELGVKGRQLEGRLLPETYYYTQGTSANTIIRRAYQAMESYSQKVWESRKVDVKIKTRYQLLILASLIQKETGQVDEMPKIASVFMNRLHHHMRLQTDPTVIYGLKEQYQGRLTYADLKKKTPYNTYIIYGLPPTPIAMPGRKALQAAAHPATTNYYYFVAKGHGKHYFSRSLKEHNRAVRKYILKK